MKLPEWKCPSPEVMQQMSTANKTELWQSRMREIQGAICVSSLFPVIVGYAGIIGIIQSYITPLTIAPTITLVGLTLLKPAAGYAGGHWGISVMSIVLLTIFSEFTKNIFVIKYKNRNDKMIKISILQMFPVLLTLILTWIFCTIITITDVLSEGNPARTDLKMDVLYNSTWFRIPYPGQWGTPTVSLAATIGMLSGVIAVSIESIGSYYACARIAGVPPPPQHVINRGMGAEGVGCVLAGLFGTGNGTCSYAENIAIIGITKVASRSVVITGAAIMMLLALISKFGALFITIPDPVVGGIFIVTFGMIAAVGISTLQFTNLNSSRNLYILGLSVFLPLVLNEWFDRNQNAIQTGSLMADQILTVLLSTTVFVGGVTGFILDNTIPGTDEERGLTIWRNQYKPSNNDREVSCYDLPFVMFYIRKWKWTYKVPICPTYSEKDTNETTN